MRVLWAYLRPHRALVALALVLAAVSQVLALVDPIIFGWIVDGYATHRTGKTHDELVAGALRLLALAVAVAVLSRLAKALQEYLTRLGIDGSRIEVASLGREVPVDPSPNEAAYAKNRRDEFEAIAGAQSLVAPR